MLYRRGCYADVMKGIPFRGIIFYPPRLLDNFKIRVYWRRYHYCLLSGASIGVRRFKGLLETENCYFVDMRDFIIMRYHL